MFKTERFLARRITVECMSRSTCAFRGRTASMTGPLELEGTVLLILISQGVILKTPLRARFQGKRGEKIPQFSTLVWKRWFHFKEVESLPSCIKLNSINRFFSRFMDNLVRAHILNLLNFFVLASCFSLSNGFIQPLDKLKEDVSTKKSSEGSGSLLWGQWIRKEIFYRNVC